MTAVIRLARAVLVCVAAATWVGACAARAPARPDGPATPDASAIDAFTQATKQCPGLKTMTSELRLSGRAGAEKIRGTLHTGLAAPASVRFEAVAPFGQPFFILAGRENRATLLLPRDQRVLEDAAVADLLERLTGLRLTANDLRLILTGCLAEPAVPADGRSWSSGWRAVTLKNPAAGTPAGPPSSSGATAPEMTAYLRAVNGAPLVVAANRGPWQIDYSNHLNGWPRTVRIRSAADQGIDITAALEQIAINTDIDEKAFVVDIPSGAAPMTLEHLRSVAPLRSSGQPRASARDIPAEALGLVGSTFSARSALGPLCGNLTSADSRSRPHSRPDAGARRPCRLSR